MRAPDFWRSDNGLARLLEPFGLIYGTVTARRMARAKPATATVPVICVGNLTVGGTGKTPVAAAIAAHLAARGRHPAILMRGYGGNLKGPVKVSAHNHGVDDVGDEALLHARAVPTWVARRRAAADIQPMLDEAYNVGAIPVTTGKDAVRLDPDQRQQVNVLNITATWDDVHQLDALLNKVIGD